MGVSIEAYERFLSHSINVQAGTYPESGVEIVLPWSIDRDPSDGAASESCFVTVLLKSWGRRADTMMCPLLRRRAKAAVSGCASFLPASGKEEASAAFDSYFPCADLRASLSSAALSCRGRSTRVGVRLLVKTRGARLDGLVCVSMSSMEGEAALLRSARQSAIGSLTLWMAKLNVSNAVVISRREMFIPASG